MTDTIRFQLNGRPVTLETDATRSLLWTLRTDLELTGTKYGCGIGLCGACTVLVDGRVARACQMTLGDVRAKAVTTIEGLAEGDRVAPIQEAFQEHGALQCGFCTSGMILNAYALLLKKPQPTRAEIIREMDDNLCRCGSHTRILDAIQEASGAMKGGAR
jgi:nicotinate dehydrogenase subunit A